MIQLQKGERAPDFALVDQNGIIVSLSDFRGRRVLLFFYPKAGSAGCTNQGASLRDAKEEFEKMGVVIVGISGDTLQAQKKFDEKHMLGFQLLSDSDHKISEAYGVWGEKTTAGKKSMGITRSAFLIDWNGTVMEAWYKITPKDTVPKALKTMQNELGK